MPLLFRRSGLLAALPEGAAFQAKAVTLSGATSRYTRGADLTSNADSKFFFFSMWINPTGVVGAQNIVTTGGNEILVGLESTGKLQLVGENAAGTSILNIRANASLTAGVLVHVCGSVDMDNVSNRWLRISGVNQAITASVYQTTPDNVINHTVGNFAIGANPAGGVPFIGTIAEVWIDNTQFIANTDANVLKFISTVSGSGQAIDLGPTGTLPGFGTPRVYLSRRNGVSDFATNKGSGGGFTVTGTPGDGGNIPSAGGGGGSPPPPSDYDDLPIRSRNPKLYLPLEESSGTPADAAAAGYGGTISVVGTPTNYGLTTTKGKGIRLGTTAYIQATHHAVFETPNGDGTGAPYNANVIVESEVTFSIHCSFPAALANDWVIFSKDDDETDLLPGVSLRVHADGSVELRVREHKYRTDVRMFAPAGTVAVSSEHHFTVSLGYEGAWFTVDGRQAELGFKNGLAWWGLDHRRNGIEEAGSAIASSVRTRNTSAIRLGRTGDQSASADIVVTKFAVFYSGAIRIAKGQVTPGFTLAACQALAGASGAVLLDSRFTAASASPTAGTNTIQAAIDSCTPNGTVTLSGTYTQTVNLVLKSGVRLTSTAGATVNLSSTAQVNTAFPTVAPALTGGGNLAVGAASYAVTVPGTILNTNQEAVFLVVEDITKPLGGLYGVPSTNVENTATRRSDMIPIRARTGSSLTFTRGVYFDHPTATRQNNPVAFNCHYDIQVDGAITIQRPGGVTTSPVVYIHGVRRCAMHNGVTIQQTSTAATDVIGCKFIGCVEVRVSGCTVRTESPQGADTTVHPYGLQFQGCAHYDCFNHTGYSRGWHSFDSEVRNPLSTWGLGGPATSLYGGQFGDLRNSTMSSTTNLFPAIMHDSIAITFIDLAYSHGGIDIAGWGHDIQTIVTQTSSSMTAELGFFRGAGGLYIWHCDMNDTLGKWGSGRFGVRRSNFGDLHYNGPGTSGTSIPPNNTNLFTDVDPATNGMPWA